MLLGPHINIQEIPKAQREINMKIVYEFCQIEVNLLDRFASLPKTT